MSLSKIIHPSQSFTRLEIYHHIYDKILFTPVPVPRNGARVLPLEVVAVPGHGAQIFARAPTKSSVQTSARAREPGTGT